MTADLDTYLDAWPQPSGKECRVGWGLSLLDDDQAGKLRRIIGGRLAEPERIEGLFAARRMYVPVTSIRRHQRGGCRNCRETKAAA